MVTQTSGNSTVGNAIFVYDTDVPGTRSTSSRILTDKVGIVRAQVDHLQEDTTGLHRNVRRNEVVELAAKLSKNATLDNLMHLSDLGFAWRDIARMLNVSVPAVQKWRRKEPIAGSNRGKIAELLATCKMTEDVYMVNDPASWFEMPLKQEVALTPIDLYAAGRQDLVLEAAGGHMDKEALLTEFDAEWKQKYVATNFEAFIASDGVWSVRPIGR